MNLYILTDKLDITGGGSNHSLDLVARALSERGINVSVITVNVDGENAFPESYPYTIAETNLSGDSRIETVRNTLRALRRSDAHLIHVFDPSFAPIAGLYARSADTPVVCRLNTYTLFCTNNDVIDGGCYENCTLRKKIAHAPGSVRDNLGNLPKFAFDDLLSPRVLRNVDRFLAQSPAVKDVYTSNGLPESKVTVLSNFYDPDFAGRKDTHDYAVGDVDRLLYVGRLYPRKGVDVLLRAVSRLDDPPHVDLVGNGPQRPELERLVNSHDFTDTVTFHGWVDHDELPGFYRNADLFVHPGRWPEPSGRAILEALQCGCLPIVSDIGGPPWILDHPNLSFTPEDECALAKKIRELRDGMIMVPSRHLQQRLERFTPEAIVSRLIREYDRVSDESIDTTVETSGVIDD